MSRRYRLSLLMGCPAGGVSCTGACSPCRCGALWGACLLCRPPALPPRCLVGWRGCFGRLPTPPLVYFPAPLPRRGRISPLPPFPSGEGGDFLFSYARGFAPCIPGIRPPAALTVPAKQVPSGGLAPRRCRLGGRWRYPAGACPLCRLPPPPLAFFPAPYPPDPLPRWGRGRFFVFLCKGLRPLHPGGCTHGSPPKRKKGVP